MAHENKQRQLDEKTQNRQYQHSNKTIAEQLSDANKEIEDLKLQLAWLDRPYE
ncbi:hypothetical protein [Thalassotalea sp. PLHSN55]|uniref:hypothetical protein n=1 Tax=Thalassotalea sp. PLHSN55 TaxID=3435888 RepID=UPI003F8530AD